MKAICTILCILFGVIGLQGQSLIPPVWFAYDNDGNMTVRYVLSLFEINEDGEPDTETHGEQQKQMQKTDVFSVVLEKQTISVYPNPTRGTITLGISPLDTDTRNFVCLYDMSGRLLQTVPIRSDLTSLEITGTAGLYLLDIHLGQNVSKWKIIKE